MAKVITKNSFTPGSAPSGLSAGELAINVADKKIFVGNAVEGVVTLHDQNNIVTSVNGLTGAIINIPRTISANTFTVLQTMSAGITTSNLYVSAGSTFNSSVYIGGSATIENSTGNLVVNKNNPLSFDTTSLVLTSYDFNPDPFTSTLSATTSPTVNTTHTLPSVSGTLLNTASNYVSTFNGRTGAVQGVSAAVAGAGISVSGATGSVTITNVGVLSVNGQTGAVTVSASAAGSNGWVQYYDNGGLSADNGFVYTSSNETLQIGSGSKPLVLYTTASGGVIESPGNSSTTLDLIGGTNGGGSVRIGDFAVSTNGTNIQLTDSAQTINLRGTISFISPDGVYTNTFPGSTGATGQVLTTTAGGSLYWSTPSTSGGGLSWSAVTADRSLVAEEGVLANKSSGTLTLTLPTTAALGKVIRVSGMQNTWRIAQNASQKIHFGKTTTTTGTGGYLENTNARDAVELVCCVADLEWNVISSIGNITIV